MDLTGQLNLTSGLFIHAAADINFQTASVSLTLTPQGGSPVTVFSSTPVTGLTPYQSPRRLPGPELDHVDCKLRSGQRGCGIHWRSFAGDHLVRFAVLCREREPVVRPNRRGAERRGPAGVLHGRVRLSRRLRAKWRELPVGRGERNVAEGQNLQVVRIPIIDDRLHDGNKISEPLHQQSDVRGTLGSPIVSTLTIVNTDASPPTVSSHVSLVYAPHTRRVVGFRLQFSQPMDPTSSQNLANYEVLLPPAHKHGQARQVPLLRAALDPTGQFVTLTRANLSQHLTKLVKIIVRGQPTTGLLSKSGTFLAGTGGVSGTDASLIVSI